MPKDGAPLVLAVAEILSLPVAVQRVEPVDGPAITVLRLLDTKPVDDIATTVADEACRRPFGHTANSRTSPANRVRITVTKSATVSPVNIGSEMTGVDGNRTHYHSLYHSVNAGYAAYFITYFAVLLNGNIC